MYPDCGLWIVKTLGRGKLDCGLWIVDSVKHWEETPGLWIVDCENTGKRLVKKVDCGLWFQLTKPKKRWIVDCDYARRVEVRNAKPLYLELCSGPPLTSFRPPPSVVRSE